VTAAEVERQRRQKNSRVTSGSAYISGLSIFSWPSFYGTTHSSGAVRDMAG
jgi:hypothetical protein